MTFRERQDPGFAGSAVQFRISPPRDGGFIEPERQLASRDERSIVLGPISDTKQENIVIFVMYLSYWLSYYFGNLQ
jgi:hypothetical protein